MSEPVGADLPVARDGVGQLSKDALRAPAPGDAPGRHRSQPRELPPVLALPEYHYWRLIDRLARGQRSRNTDNYCTGQ